MKIWGSFRYIKFNIIKIIKNMRIFNVYIILFISTFFICAQCEKNEIELLNPDAKVILQHNYLIITSADGQPAQVEVKYTVLGIGGENEQKTLRKTTPFIFGGENVCCSYSIKRESANGYIRHYLNRNYQPNGADYLSIKNLSSSEIEYAVIGNNKITYYNVNDLSNGNSTYFTQNLNTLLDKTKVIEQPPIPIYKKAPILYLLFPDKAPQHVCYALLEGDGTTEGGLFKAKKVPLKSPYVGDLTLTTPYTIEQIMELYKQEYENQGSILFSNYVAYTLKQQGKRYTYSLKEEGERGDRKLLYYGKIAPHQSLDNQGEIWFINAAEARYYDVFHLE